MARAVVTEVVVNSRELFLPGGDVNDWAVDIADELGDRARLYCPVESGKLKSTIKSGAWNMTDHTIQIELSAGPAYNTTKRQRTDYSVLVLGGTAAQGRQYIYSTRGWTNKAAIDNLFRRTRSPYQGVIFPKGTRKGWYMKLRGSGAYRLRVKGQKANPFLSDAYHETRRRHRELPHIPTLPPMSARLG